MDKPKVLSFLSARTALSYAFLMSKDSWADQVGKKKDSLNILE